MTANTMFAGLIFGLIGMAAFGYGKKQQNLRVLLIAALLMIYPYFVENSIALWAIGAALTLSLFVWR